MVAVKFAAFSDPVGFCFVAIETRTDSFRELCVHVSTREGSNGGGGHGRGCTRSEDSGRWSLWKSLKDLHVQAVAPLRAGLISHGAQLGNRHPFVALHGATLEHPENLGSSPCQSCCALETEVNDLFLVAPEPVSQTSAFPGISGQGRVQMVLCCYSHTFTFDKRMGVEKGPQQREQ